ncbi:AAA family ATPase, partial [Planctomycetota bacterium]|nr:AAA family ATPase [Planctomycetota bacterium]
MTSHSRMSRPFFGRENELQQLRVAFEAAAGRQENNQAGPQMVAILAESGHGKSRLVQQLYLQLTTDPHWDPDEWNYWPDAFGDVGSQLNVNPSFEGHTPQGPPKFLWLGVRWQPTDQRNLDARSALPDLRSQVGVHLDLLERHQPLFQQALNRATTTLRKESLGEAAEAAFDAVLEELPLGGYLLRSARAVSNLATRSSAAHDVREEHSNSLSEELMDCFRSVLSGRGSTPLVLWLDDAQWADQETRDWLGVLWTQAQRQGWPLLVILTHWEREWMEERGASASQGWTRFEGEADVATISLARASDPNLTNLAAAELPGLTPSQLSSLVQKAGGNYLSMVENLSDLRQELMHFVGDDPRGPLSLEGEAFVETWESDRSRRIQQRFRTLEPRVRHLLGWSSRLGIRFLKSVVEDFARRAARGGTEPDDPVQLLSWCVDPGVILGQPSPLTREFRDRAFHAAAAEHFERYGRRDEALLLAVLREHLIGWVQRSFSPDGELLGAEEEDGSRALPQDAAVSLSDLGRRSELRDLLDLAIRELSLDGPQDESQAALRAHFLSIDNDAHEGLWDRIRLHGSRLSDLNWGAVSVPTLGPTCLSDLVEHLETSGLPFLASAVAERQLAEALGRNRGKPEQREALARALSSSASLFVELGRLDDALPRYLQALEIHEALAEELGTPQSRRDVSFSLGNIADVERDQGRLDDALPRYLQALEIHEALAEELGTPQSRRDVSFSLGNIADVERDQG